MSMAEKTALVTGASRGIGWAIAQKLGQSGAKVIGTSTTEAGAEALQAKFTEAGLSDCKARVLDVCDAAACEALVKEIGGVHILVNNAAVTRDTLMLRMKDADWDTVIATNLSAVARMSKLVLRGMMKQRQGRIISISSVVGFTGNAGQVNYAAAKAGVIGMSRSLAREVAPRGVTVNVVAPGFIDTDMTKDLPEDVKTGLLGQIPMGRLGQAEEIANAVAFLASDEAGYMTGQSLHVNGGMYMG